MGRHVAVVRLTDAAAGVPLKAKDSKGSPTRSVPAVAEAASRGTGNPYPKRSRPPVGYLAASSLAAVAPTDGAPPVLDAVAYSAARSDRAVGRRRGVQKVGGAAAGRFPLAITLAQRKPLSRAPLLPGVRMEAG